MPTRLGEKVISGTLFSGNASPVIKHLKLKSAKAHFKQFFELSNTRSQEFGVRFLELAAPIIIVMIDHVSNLMPNNYIGIQLLLEIPLLKSMAL